MKMPKTFDHTLAYLQSLAWLPPALLLLALSSVFIFSGDRSYFYREEMHNALSAKHLTIADNLSNEHNFLMFHIRTLDADGKPTYEPYNRFPIGGYGLIKLAILPFGDALSAKIYAARMLMLICFASAAALAYLSLRRITSSDWIALMATLLAFSSAYCLYYSDIIQTEAMIDLFAVMLAFHGMVIFEQEERFLQLPIKACLALLLGWHVYALLLPFIAFGLMRDLIKARSGISHTTGALGRLKHSLLHLIRSRYLALGVIALLFGISMLTFNFTNEYFALNREVALTELPSFNSMIKRTGVSPNLGQDSAKYLSWPAFPERQFYRIGMMSIPYAFFPSFVEYSTDPPPQSLVILGMAVFVASLICLPFLRRHKILLLSLSLSGFFWALPMRYVAAYPWHNFEALFYIGITLTLFSLTLLYLRKLTSERFAAALSIAALLIFVVSALRMSQLISPNQTDDLHHAAIADFESIRNITDRKAIRVNPMPRFLKNARNSIAYYLAGRTIVTGDETAHSAPPSDLVVSGSPPNGLASLTPQNRLVFLYEWDDYHRYIDEIIDQADAPSIRSVFNVYLYHNALMYVKDDCSNADTSEKFFLALYPSDENALPDDRRQHGFDNLDFYFHEQDVRRGKRCIAITPLPYYDIVRIQTGQFTQQADGSYKHLWEDEIHLTEAAH